MHPCFGNTAVVMPNMQCAIGIFSRSRPNHHIWPIQVPPDICDSSTTRHMWFKYHQTYVIQVPPDICDSSTDRHMWRKCVLLWWKKIPTHEDNKLFFPWVSLLSTLIGQSMPSYGCAAKNCTHRVNLHNYQRNCIASTVHIWRCD